MSSNAEKSIFNLLEKVLPFYKNAHIEHIFYFFQQLWKTINTTCKHLNKNIVIICERIFEYHLTRKNDDFSFYYKYFRIYKDFTFYALGSSLEIPSIIVQKNDMILDAQNLQFDILTFNLWLEVAGEINVLSFIDVKQFLEKAEEQIENASLGIAGFIELEKFLIKQINETEQNSNEIIMRREITDIKRRLFNLYSNKS